MTTRVHASDSRSSRFRVPTLPDIFWGPLANGFRRLTQWRKSGELGEVLKSRRGPAMRLEALEPRLLLSADIHYAAASGAVLDAALRIADVDGTQMLQLVDNESSAVLGQEALDEDINVTVSGDDLNDTLIIDFNGGATPHQINVAFDGGAGDDTLRGPAGNTVWNVNGANAGSAGAVSFSGVENLEGAADNEDTFVFGASGSLSGVADGGAGGFDSLVVLGSYTTIVFSPTGPDSGSVTLDGVGIAYSGLEPVDTTGSTADDLVLNLTGVDEVAFLEDDGVAANGTSRLRSGNATFETHTFATPATSLTVNLGGGADTLTISALDSLFDANVTINAGDGDDDITLNAKTGGTYTINGQGDTDTVRATRDANMSLTNNQLTVGADVFGLSGIQTAVLTGGGSANTFTVSGWTGSGTLAGAGGTGDTVVLTKDAANFALTNTSLSATGGPTMTLSGIEVANLTGGAGSNTFTVGNTWSGTANLAGLAGDDHYVLDDNWGTVNVTEAASGGSDTLDFSLLIGDTLTVSADRTQIDSTDGSTLTQIGELAEEINVSLLAGYVDAGGELTSALDDVAALVDRLQTAAGAITELVNQIPLLNQTGASLAGLIGLSDAFEAFRDELNGIISGLADPIELSFLVDSLNGLTEPAPFSTISFSTDYRGTPPAANPPAADDHLEVLIDIELAGGVSESIPFSLGADAEAAGITIDAMLNVDVDLTGHLTLGLTTTGSPEVFLVPGGTLTLAVDANVTFSSGTVVNLGFLELEIASGSANVEGGLILELEDPDTDGRITLTELATELPEDLVTVTEDADPTTPGIEPQVFDVSAVLTVNPGVEVAGLDLSDGSVDVTFTVNLAGSIFEGSTPSVSLTADPGTPGDITDDTDLLDFSNIGPTAVLGMLGQVRDMLLAMASSELLNAEIPFSDGKTLGDVLDFATSFKSEFLDPLFASGDSLRPDDDGDGDIDLNFSSIQSLLDAIEAGLGLASGSLTAAYDPDTQELTFTFTIDAGLGFGEAKVETATPGGPANEVQRLSLNAVATGVSDGIDDTFRLAFPDGDGLLEFTDPIALSLTALNDGVDNAGDDPNAALIETRLEDLDGIDNVAVTFEGNAFRIEFLGALAGQNVAQLKSDATELAGRFSVDFGASLGGIASIETSGSFGILASLMSTLTFGIDLSPSQALEITPVLYSTDAGVSIERPEGATNNKVQILAVKNATDGAYNLVFDPTPGSPGDEETTADIDFDDSAGTIATRLENLVSVTDVDVVLGNFGNHRFYVITFNNPGDPPALLAAVSNPLDPLIGPADDGRLSGDANFSFQLFNDPAVIVATKVAGLVGTDEQQTVTVVNADGGTFTLSFGGETTSSIAFDAPAAITDEVVPGESVEARLEALSGITEVSVTRTAATGATVYTITFTNPGDANVAQLTADASELTNSTPLDTFNAEDFVNATVLQAATATNASPADLAADVQKAVNEALGAARLTLGFRDTGTGEFTTGALTDATAAVTAVDFPLTRFPSDIGFTLVLNLSSLGFLSSETILDGNTFTAGETPLATGSLPAQIPFTLIVGGQEKLGVLARTDVLAVGLATALDNAIDTALSGTGVSVTVATAAGGELEITPSGGSLVVDVAQMQEVSGRLRAVDVLDGNASGDLDAAELTASVSAATLTTKLQAAIEDALDKAGLGDAGEFQITVDENAGKLRFDVTSVPADGVDTIEVVFESRVSVEAGGGRISVSPLPVKLSTVDLDPAVNLDRRMEVTTGTATGFADHYADPSFQELGLLSAPTRFDGVTADPIEFTLVINGTEIPEVTLAAQPFNTSIDDLVADLQAAIDVQLVVEFGDSDVDGDLVSDVEVFVVEQSGIKGNRIGLRGDPEVVSELSLNVALDRNTATAAIDLNGAVSELGFATGTGETRRSKATHFFLEDVALAADLELTATDVSATATFGFLGITATGNGTLGDDRFIDASLDVDVRDPLTGSNRLTVKALTEALGDGKFLFDAAAAPAERGPIDGALSGGIGFLLEIEPDGVLAGLPGDLNASLALTAASPNWFISPPTLNDPLGFGPDPQPFSTITLDNPAPSNGRLAQTASFVLSQQVGPDTFEAVGILRAADTASFATRTQLETALQDALNDAKARLDDAVPDSDELGALTVDIDDGTGEIDITGPTGLSIRGNLIKIEFTGPDVTAILDRFQDLSFEDIIAGLEFIVDFLQTLDGSGGVGDAVAGALDFKLPLIDRSVADLVDIAGDFAARLEAIEADPAGSIQALEDLIRDQLSIPPGPPVLSFDPLTGVLHFDFSFGTGVNLSRPFNLDLADAGLPEVFTNLVGVSASGNLAVNAGVTLDLELGLDLSGPDKAFFLVTDDSATPGDKEGTKLSASAGASGDNLEFTAQLGPFGLFVVGGSASLDGAIDIFLADPGDQRFDLVTFGSGGITFDLPGLADIDVDFDAGAQASLPLFIGTEDLQIPLGDPNILSVTFDIDELLVSGSGDPDGDADDIEFTVPTFDFDDLAGNLPGIFALLSDPAVIIDGLDRVLLTLQDALNGQIFGVELPLVGDLLADNPAANIVEDFRDEFLQPLAHTLRENNVNLDGLVSLIQNTISGAFIGLGLLKDSGNAGGINADDIVKTGGDLTDDFIQFDFDIGKTFTFTAPEIVFDLGIPVLGIAAAFTPRIRIDFNLHVGFGVQEDKGFYFVTDDPDTPESDEELTVSVSIDFSNDADSGGDVDPSERATVEGRLLFLALTLTDGFDIDADGLDFSEPDEFDPQNEDFTRLFLGGSVDVVDPSGDGMLTIPEMISGSLSEIFQPELVGGAVLRAHAVVDFSLLDPSLANVLPSVSTDILVDFVVTANPDDGLIVSPPEVVFLDVTLDLGSFISDFAGPILNQIGDILEPLDFLIGPDGFLNARIPLLSDLAGTTITGKDLIVLFDPDNGPKVVAFLDFVENLFFLIDLVNDAASEGSLMLNFGDLVLFDAPGGTNFSDLPGFSPLEVGLPSVSDLRSLKNLKNATLPALPEPELPTGPSKTSRFTAGVTESASIQFQILKPETIFKLIMGQPDVTLVTVELPEFGFDFFYRQEFPIIGPLVGFFGGGVGGVIDMGFGYDTRGLTQFLASDNPAHLLNGFFLTDIDFDTGFDRPEAFLTAQIAVGAGLSIGLAKMGVEGGIEANIFFNLADLDDDGKVRIDELAGNLVANDFNPLAIFDISGIIEFFLRAFVEINLLITTIEFEYEFVRLTLFEFDIPFERPSLLASQSGDTLTLHVGPNAESRLRGEINDVAETIHVESFGGGVVVWSDQFNVAQGVARISPFFGVTKVVADGGVGNDTIDLGGLNSSVVAEVHGGDGNDTLTGGAAADRLFGDAGDDHLFGNAGEDFLDGGLGADELHGLGQNDRLTAGAGNDTLFGGADSDFLDGGPGNDQMDGGDGDDFYVLESAGSLDFISGGGDGLDILDFRDKSENVSFFLRGGQALAGWGARLGTFTNPLNTVPLGDWLEDFEHMVVATSLAELSAVFGGLGADTFHVYETRTDSIVTLLDGKEASDTYIFYSDDGTPIDVFVSDNGNAWDLANLIEVRGTASAEDIAVTANDITVENAFMTLAGVEQIIRYESPAVDANLLQIKVRALGGDDRVAVDSTSVSVPVKVFAGSGDDTLTVGDGVVDNIDAVSQPGVNQPFGIGPLVLVGEAGHDTVIIDDSLDNNFGDVGDTGYLTSFLETRTGGTQVEVGVVNGLGMTLNELVGSDIADDEFELPGAPVELAYTLEEAATTVFVDVLDENGILVNSIAGTGASGLNTVAFDGTDFVDFPLPAGTYSYKIRALKSTPGRVEFEGFEAVDVRLGLDMDIFSIGVEDIHGELPLNRQALFDEFTYTVEGMTIVSGGGDDDTIRIKATNTLDRDDLNTALGVVSASTLTQGGPGNETQEVLVGADVGLFTLGFRFMETAPIAFDASALEVEEALERLFIIGENNVEVTEIADGFTVEFINDLGGIDVAQLVARVTPLAVGGGSGSDVLLVQALNQDLFFLGGSDDDIVRLNIDVESFEPLAFNGVNAEVTLDGGNESDTYNIGLIGGITHSLVNVFDSGGPGTDVLNVEGTDNPDLFLLRAAAAQSGLAFVALLNTDPNFERVNYNTHLETINIFSKLGNDRFYFDDTRAAITVFADEGEDFFQVGQLYKSQRTTEQAGVAVEDVFATIETTRGFLSSGISVDLTINAGAGNDEFIVFHNKAVLTVNGEDGDDRFLIQAFALVGSQEDLRERTDVSGGADADFIAYAVNAPVAINGGDGFDTVVVVGTEFSDDFVITEDGVFGAGINVSFVNVETVEVSGTEGDDRFFILGTGATFTTSIVGDLGSDTFFVNGPTPANGVISNDLLGHSGIITHDVVSSTGSGFDGLKAVGVSANVADNDEPAIIISQSDGASQVVEGGGWDTYTVVLSRPPRPDTQVKVSALPPEGLVFVDELGDEILKDDGVTPDGVELRFDGTNWHLPQTVRFKAIADGEPEGNQTAAIQHKVSTFEVIEEPVFVTQDVVIDVPIFAFVPIFHTFNLGFLGSVTLLVGIQKIEIDSFQVLVGTEEVLVGIIGTEATVSDAFTGVAEEAIGRKSDVNVQTTQDGDPEIFADEIQTVTVDPAVGVYRLRFGLEDTAPIGSGETADGLQLKLEALAGIGPGNVDVEKDGDVFTITFGGSLAATDVEALIPRVDASLLDDEAEFPTAATDPSRPQGLRGSFVTIIDDPANPSSVGQSRQILSNTGTLLTLDQAWDALPSDQARYEILQFNGLVIPTVEVAIEDSDVASLVVSQSGAETIVSEGSASGSDTISVSLGMAPAAGETVTVTLDGHGQLEFSDATLEFDEINYLIPQVVTVTAVDDLAVEGFHRADLTLTSSSSVAESGYNGVEKTLVASVGDNDHEGVLIEESNGSTDVAEGGATDSYTVVLTQAPADGETVTVAVTAQPTRTSKTGSIAGHPDSVRAFIEQLEVSLDGVNFFTSVDVMFDDGNWDETQTVFVRAVDDDIVDGGDTQVFAPILDLANNIQGPLFIIGGIGVDRSGLFEREPIMLPVSANPAFEREVNFKDSIGEVVEATEETADDPATITIDPTDGDLLDFLGVDSVEELDLEELVNVAIEITRGAGKNKVRFIENAEFDGGGNLLLTLNKAWDNPLTPPGVPDGTSEYTLFDANPNFFVIEADQTDLLFFNDTDNVTSIPDTPFAEGRLFVDGSFSFGRLTGLGMGGDRVIGGRLQPGGVSFQELEEVEINLGTGANAFTIDDTHDGATTLNTGAGGDVVDIKAISGHTFVNTGAGSDTVNVHNEDQALSELLGLLTVSGDIAQAAVVHLANGSPAIGELVRAVDAIQRLTIDATGGTFTLALGGDITDDLPFNIGADDLRTAVEGLEGVGAGNVQVTKAGSVYRISFVGALGAQEVELLAVNDFNLTNGLASHDELNIDDQGSALPTVGVLTATTLTGLSLPQANEIQSIVVDATEGAFRLSFDGAETGDLAFDASAAEVESALEALLPGIGTGNVAVTKNDDVYGVRFQGDLTNADVSQIAALPQASLKKTIELPGGEFDVVDGSVAASTRVNGNEARPVNDVQTLTIDATDGSYTLTVFGRTTDAIAFDASAEVVRKALQLAVADDKFEEVKTDITVDKYDNVYVIGFQGKLREIGGAPGVDFMTADTDLLTGTAEIATRMDGINYYGFETLNIDLNSEGHVFNVQGTTAGSSGFEGFASTNVRLGDGDERIFIASNADLDFHSAPGFEFLTGNLDGVLGALNLDTESGRHRLLISDEGASVGDDNVRITDVQPGTAGSIIDEPQGLAAIADIWIQGLAEGGISYRTDGDFHDGIIYWTGSGDDTIVIDGTHTRPGERTMTLLNTGLGDDHVTVDLDNPADDGFFVLHTMGGAAAHTPVDPAIPGSDDDDTVRAAASTLPLIIFGGLGDDDIIAGQNKDIVFGDLGRVQFVIPGATPEEDVLIAVLGFGGRGDMISSEIIDPRWVISRDLTLGGVDILEGGGDEDILVGGAGGNSIGDYIDGDGADDLIFGDSVRLMRRDTDVGAIGDITNPRFQTLSGTQIYDTSPTNSAGGALEDGTARNYRNQDGSVPSWAEYRIIELYHSFAIEAGDVPELLDSFGDDYIAGGARNDVIFGQLGDDIVQGDGSIASAVGAESIIGNRVAAALAGAGLNPVGAQRLPDRSLDITPSFEAATDGDDTIEGNGGGDVIFGNLGQDDLIGGNSSLFTLNLYEERPDGPDMIFGGSGERIGRYADVGAGDTFFAERHGRDADAIAGDNADIFRLVGTNGTVGAGAFLTFNYDVNGLPAEGYAASLRIIPRAVELLDYTPGGPDFTAVNESLSGPAGVAINPTTTLRDIGAADEVHGESGDDFVYGMVGGDVLFGDSQDDNMVGGYGADWMSGGTGDDGMLGDDGRLFASRNSTSFGEPLYGIAAISPAEINALVQTPGGMRQATINVGGLLKYTADLTPQNLQPSQPTPPDPLFRPLYANDIIYGGLGHDAIHGGAGDDAISGAEAPEEAYTNNYDANGAIGLPAVQRSDFLHPYNPGNVLGYAPTGPNATKFALYDANDGLRKILLNGNGTLNKTNSGLPWLLNFDATEGPPDTKWFIDTTYPALATDGDDHLFGDLGNDWMVGGTGRDVMFSGWGDDLMNADDNHNTNGGLNNGFDATSNDTNPSHEDLAFGGAGRDVLIVNTNGDRAIDWLGEFNTFLTPYAQFGAVSVSRMLQPQLAEFLYALSKSAGADPTLTAQYGGAPARNGEPFGELGLVVQQDAAWQAQTGGPRDPQAGNSGGGKVDVKNNPGTTNVLPIYLTAGASGPATGTAEYLTDSQLAPQVAAATQYWAQELGAGDSRLDALGSLRIEVGNLSDDRLGAALGNSILIDSDAAGRGWGTDGSGAGSAAFGGMDLLSVVTHEIGHALGFGHDDAGDFGVMAGNLDAGLRPRLDAAGSIPDSGGLLTSLQIPLQPGRSQETWGIPGGLPGFDLGSGPNGVNGHGSIDWQAGPADGWNTGFSPFAPTQALKSAASNFPDYLMKLSKSYLGGTANDGGQPGYDQLGATLTKSAKQSRAARGLF